MPRRPDGSWIISELADLRGGYRISAHCMALGPDGRPCGHFAVLDTEQLIRHLGGHYPLSLLHGRLQSVMKCSACGSQEVTLRVGSAPPPRTAGAAPDRIVELGSAHLAAAPLAEGAAPEASAGIRAARQTRE